MVRHAIEIIHLGSKLIKASINSTRTSSRNGIKYRLYSGVNDECVVRYDNETGKGDHRHYGNREEPYSFESLDKLITDFRYDCTRLTDWCWE